MSEENIKNIIELSPEEKAYVYQQVAAFEPFFMPDSDVGVKVARLEGDHGEKEYRVTLMLSGGGTFVQSIGSGSSFFEATRFAKEDLLKHLHSIQEAVESSEASQDELSEENLDQPLVGSSRKGYLH